jgi:hypothetical protein
MIPSLHLSFLCRKAFVKMLAGQFREYRGIQTEAIKSEQKIRPPPLPEYTPPRPRLPGSAILPIIGDQHGSSDKRASLKLGSIYSLVPARPLLREFHLDQRGVLNKILQGGRISMVPAEIRAAENPAAGLQVQDLAGTGWQIRMDSFFQVKGEIRLRLQVCVPVTLPGRARDENAPLRAGEPDLDAPFLARLSAAGGDVYCYISLKSVQNFRVHAFIFLFPSAS